jgi:putative transposase
MTTAVSELTQQQLPVTHACAALGMPRSSYYRVQHPAQPLSEPAPRSKPPRSLSEGERSQVRSLLNSERFVDSSPRQVYATLLDEGQYHCSIRTLYRILADHDELQERRNQLRHPPAAKPELVATAPNQVWSWDITQLPSSLKGLSFSLYVVLDLFSRLVVGWLVAEQQSAALAQHLLFESCRKQGVQPDQLTLHADRGGPMIAKPLAQLLADLGVTKSHSRPHTANDNPFSEAQFKTLKYRPDYPQTFGSLQDARSWSHSFFDWYNHQHHHTGIALLTPADVHYGRADEMIAQRQAVLNAAYLQHPARFVKGSPVPPQLPTAVWINPPKLDDKEAPLLP